MYVPLCKKIRSTLKILTNTQVFLTHKGEGLPLVVDELIGVLSLKVVDELDEVAVAVFAMVLGAQVCQLTLTLDVVDADLALLHQFLHEKIIPQGDMLCARTVGTVAGDVQRRRIIDMQRHAAKALTEAQLQYHVGQNPASFFIIRAAATSSASIVGCMVSPSSSTWKMTGAWSPSRCMMT